MRVCFCEKGKILYVFFLIIIIPHTIAKYNVVIRCQMYVVVPRRWDLRIYTVIVTLILNGGKNILCVVFSESKKRNVTQMGLHFNIIA